MVMAAALSIDAARALAPMAGAGLVCTLAACAWLLARAPADPAHLAQIPLGQRQAIRIREAAVLASMFFVITLAVSQAQQ